MKKQVALLPHLWISACSTSPQLVLFPVYAGDKPSPAMLRMVPIGPMNLSMRAIKQSRSDAPALQMQLDGAS
jgi:hypothetical protein